MGLEQNATNKEPFILVATRVAPNESKLFDRLAAKNQAESIEVGGLDLRLAEFPCRSLIVLVCADTTVLEAYCKRPGVLPVFLDTNGCKLSYSEKGWIVIPNLLCLEPLFDGSLTHTLSLLILDEQWMNEQQIFIAKKYFDAVSNAGGIHIFGAGNIGSQVYRTCHKRNQIVLGYVDNNPDLIGKEINNLPIKRTGDLDPLKDVVVISTGNHAEVIKKKLEALSFQNVYNLSQFFYSLKDTQQPEIGFLDDLVQNCIQWIWLGLLVRDARSREIVESMVQHRLSLDTGFIARCRDEAVQQWFDPQFIQPNSTAVFVDGGAFDGDTIISFRKYNGEASSIHGFELDPEIASRAKCRVALYPEAQIHFYGLSNDRGKIPFVSTGVTDGRLVEGADESSFASVTSVDLAVSESVTYLKLDVEGAESLAIEGAAQQIASNRPIIGVAVYHKASDPWQLVDTILKINDGYNIYLRHYTDVSFETVCYAVPDNNEQ